MSDYSMSADGAITMASQLANLTTLNFWDNNIGTEGHKFLEQLEHTRLNPYIYCKYQQ